MIKNGTYVKTYIKADGTPYASFTDALSAGMKATPKDQIKKRPPRAVKLEKRGWGYQMTYDVILCCDPGGSLAQALRVATTQKD